MRNPYEMIRRLTGRPLVLIAVFAMMGVLIWAGLAIAERPSHMDSFQNPDGCQGCHAGKGAPGTPLLKAPRERLCYECHGTFSKDRPSAKDIESTLSKFSHHPIVETSQYHINGEVLPEVDSSIPRHVACEDCHTAHLSTRDVPWKGSRGCIASQVRTGKNDIVPPGLRLRFAEEEYEMCYLCHSDSANLPGDSKNMAEQFDPNNTSYHPVEAPGRNHDVPSLVRELGITDVIRCTDCHGNSDPFGPKGPHGSDYSPLLVAEYDTEDGPEDLKHYELCYKCHDRRSILGDESFRYHNRHIVDEATSCFTCHATHGSSDPNLIEFNPLVVNPSPVDSGPVYMPGFGNSPQCFLECHGADHNNLGIFVGGVKTGEWL